MLNKVIFVYKKYINPVLVVINTDIIYLLLLITITYLFHGPKIQK